MTDEKRNIVIKGLIKYENLKLNILLTVDPNHLPIDKCFPQVQK